MATKKILCIDDSINLLQVLKKRFGFDIPDAEVITTDNGEDGLMLARREKPDVIILDINMPEMSGEEVLAQLKHPTDLGEGESSTKDIPVVVLTSRGPEEWAKFIKAGAADYISSPFDMSELVAKVKIIISGKSSQ